MKYQGLRRWALIVSIFTAGATISRGLILTFFYDIFGGCLESTGAEPSLVCEYGPQSMLNIVAALFFVVVGYALLHKTTRMVSRNWIILMAVIYAVLMMASWRLLNNLSESFAIFQGPVTFTEYLFVLYANLEMVFVASLVALFYNLVAATNRVAIDESERNAPRDLASTSRAKTTTAKSTKTTTRKKSPAKRKTATKKATSKK